MWKFRIRHWFLMLACLVASVVSACGSGRPTAHLTTIPIQVSPSNLMALPLVVAVAIHSDTAYGLQFHLTPQGTSAVTAVSPADPTRLAHPVFAYVAVHGDWALITPEANSGFRWTALASLPLVETDLPRLAQQLLPAVLRDHQVTPAHIETLPFSQAQTLFLGGRLPFWLVPATDVARLPSHSYHLITLLTASTGPIPALVLTAPPGQRAAVAASVNAALTYIHTHDANNVARLVAPYYGLSPAALTPWVRNGVALGMWPETTFPDRTTYVRLLQWLAAVPADRSDAWYASQVDPKPAAAALAGSL
ncbi:MAG: hypothetical protein K6T76_11910 [Alicyclobacillus mali]|uniref:hypothetical protein n=1 Tax=Alicyclobacillus mali (ex Roth et al. 2021) TaxID=1123961 RepID=UPI0023F23D7C|nr:hypothetical protein [Alicyclobacillus mali (ex Roth et al. 2021)]MCL6489622.1 hypothetical protein [Alicyclobacillus mali (ex Roth et al. 2021)]